MQSEIVVLLCDNVWLDDPKNAYSNILKILPQKKNENFSDKKKF